MSVLGIPGVLIITNHAFGGTLDTHLAVFTLSSMVYTALALGAYNIWKLQLDQHRKWMLRAMIWMSEIIVQRIFIFIIAFSLPTNGYYTVWTCEEAKFTELNATRFDMEFPQCQTLPPNGQIIVPAQIMSGSELICASMLRLVFGGAAWMALAVHVIGTEVYLSLTKDETERLRRISCTLQQKAGFKNPGSAGLTSDRFGDSAWSPPSKN